MACFLSLKTSERMRIDINGGRKPVTNVYAVPCGYMVLMQHDSNAHKGTLEPIKSPQAFGTRHFLSDKCVQYLYVELSSWQSRSTAQSVQLRSNVSSVARRHCM